MSLPSEKNALDRLLAAHPKLAKVADDRAGLAEIASLLLQIRHELQLSQKELAARAALPKSMISELENTANDGITLRTLVKLARATGASIDLRFRLGASRPGCVSTSLDTGRYEVSAVRTNKPSRDSVRRELAA